MKFASIFCLWLFIQFLAVCFTEDISSSLAGACCQLLTTWASPQAAHNRADCCTEANESDRLTKQVFFITQSSKWHLIVFAVFYSLEASYQVHPILRGKGLYKGMKSRRQGSGTILEAAFTRYADDYHKYYLHFQYLRFFLFYLAGIATRCCYVYYYPLNLFYFFAF